ncbi:MAG: hypothetical protein V1648_01820 [Candidatus Aenigmatarchaeota archaeon]
MVSFESFAPEGERLVFFALSGFLMRARLDGLLDFAIVACVRFGFIVEIIAGRLDLACFIIRDFYLVFGRFEYLEMIRDEAVHPRLLLGEVPREFRILLGGKGNVLVRVDFENCVAFGEAVIRVLDQLDFYYGIADICLDSYGVAVKADLFQRRFRACAHEKERARQEQRDEYN